MYLEWVCDMHGIKIEIVLLVFSFSYTYYEYPAYHTHTVSSRFFSLITFGTDININILNDKKMVCD